MKRLEISRLMDEYQDNEFFPEGGSAADAQSVKDRVLAQAVPAEQKRRMPRKKKLLLAAALAAVMVILVGAGFPSRVYQLLTGTVEFRQDTDSRTISFHHDGVFMELEDDRLYFLLDGQRTDITALISEDTPYVYDGSKPDEDLIYYVILGGTPENYGWFQWVAVPNPFPDEEGYANILTDETGLVYTYSGSFFTMRDGMLYRAGCSGNGNPDWRMFSDFKDSDIDVSRFQWLRAAADELGIPFIDTTGETVTTIYS